MIFLYFEQKMLQMSIIEPQPKLSVLSKKKNYVPDSDIIPKTTHYSIFLTTNWKTPRVRLKSVKNKGGEKRLQA